MREVKPFLMLDNASIGHIVIETFAEAEELEERVVQLVMPTV